ncbi:MAG TPA: metal-dependent transcriptional regulator [Chromatiaceae bacterium]|nr:metal-dependent transcriptional regulator [Chromatiaceae bacterium]
MRTQTTSNETVEMYLKTIAELSNGRSPIVIARVAEGLGVSPVSANEMMKRLVKQGYLKHEPYKGVTLTQSGQYIARNVIRRQRLWEVFLVEHLEFNWAGVYEAACRLEHATSNVLAESLSNYLGNPTVCPHGNPIPTADGTVHVTEQRALNTLTVGETAQVVSIQPTQTKIFAYLSKRNILPAQVVTVTDIAPMQGPITLKLDSAEVSLGLAMAALVMVGPLQTN